MRLIYGESSSTSSATKAVTLYYQRCAVYSVATCKNYIPAIQHQKILKIVS